MSKSTTSFFDQFKDKEERSQFESDFIHYYAEGTLAPDVEDAKTYAIESAVEDYNLDRKPPKKVVDSLLQGEEEIQERIEQLKEVVRKKSALKIFFEVRAAGGTFNDAAKAAGEGPAYMAQLIAKAFDFELYKEELSILKQARMEEIRRAEHVARQEQLKTIRDKVAEAIKKADFTTLPPDKLCDISFKLNELMQADLKPEPTISIAPFKSI